MNLLHRIRSAYLAFRGVPSGLYAAPMGAGIEGLSLGNVSDLLKAYRGWIYACVSLIGNNVAKIASNAHLYALRPSGREEIFEHPLLDLLYAVNPIQTEFELWWLSVVWLELCGKCFWYIPSNGLGVPGEIWPIPPDRMRVVPGGGGEIKGYLYKYRQDKISFEPHDIIYLRYPHPRSIYDGMGTLQAATYEYDAEYAMKRHRKATFDNKASLGVVLSTDQGLTKEQADVIREDWRRMHKGQDKAGIEAILHSGLHVERYVQTLAELDFVALSKLTRDDILGIFGVPASKLGLVEDVNRANAEANDRTFQGEVILPKLTMLRERLNQDLTPRFDSKLRMEFDNPVAQEWEHVLKERETHIRIGFTTINEEREKEGLEPVSWGEVPLLPMNLFPVGSPPAKSLREKSRFIEDERRTAIWHEFIARAAPIERSYVRKLKQLFMGQRVEVQDRLKQDQSGTLSVFNVALRDIDFVLQPLNDAKNEWPNLLIPFEMEAVKQGIEKGAAEHGIDPFDIETYPGVKEQIKTKTFKIVGEFTDTTWDSLRDNLTEGLEQGETIKQLAARVDKVFDFADKTRSVRIARTETIGAMNFGTLKEYEYSGLNLRKQWLTARDENVRESHSAMDGQEVELSDLFTSGDGEALQYPGDIEGPASEVINCRCTMISVPKEE